MTAVSGGAALRGASPRSSRCCGTVRSTDGRLVYLDSSATSQTPDPVIDAMTSYYTHTRASIHRGVYPLAAEATDLYEGARARIAAWLGSTVEETIFTANATAAINMVAYTWGRQNVQRGDLVVLTEMEHHSNIVPWQLLCQDREAELAYVPVSDDGLLDLDALDALLARGPRLVGVVHVSNVLGTVNPVASIARRAHEAGAVVLVDGTQAVPQLPVWLPDLDVDFYAWTGHKAYGPTGIGVLHGRRALLEEMPPFIGGGHMIRTVAANESTWTDLPVEVRGGHLADRRGDRVGRGRGLDPGDRHGRDSRSRAGSGGRGAGAAWFRGPGLDDPGPARRPRIAVRSCRSRWTAPIRTTSRTSWVVTACACARATTARSR